MPQIIHNKCYEPTKRNTLDEIKPGWFRTFKSYVSNFFSLETQIDKDIQQLFVNISEILNLSRQEQENIHSDLLRHVGQNSYYASKRLLIESLKELNKRIVHADVSQDKKVSAATRLIEGISNCSQGFHNRINEVILSFSQQDGITEFLEQLRKEIVEKIARKHTDEVHAFNRFFILAEPYQVPAINKDDEYVGAIPDRVIHEKLQSGFNEYYRFWVIINSLNEKIRTGLVVNANYDGKKDQGYNNGDYEKMFEYLEQLIGKCENPTEQWLIMSDEYLVVDLNWPNIMNQLWQKLNHEGFFSYPRKIELRLYTELFDPELPVNSIENLLFSIHSEELFSHWSQFISFLDESNWLPLDKKLAVSRKYLDLIHRNLNHHQLSQVMKLLFNKIDTFEETRLIKSILYIAIRNDRTIFSLIAHEPRILNFIQSLSFLEQVQLYQNGRPKDYFRFQNNSGTLNIYEQAEISLLLAEFDEKIRFYQSSQQQELARVMTTLHAGLKDNFQAYLSSKRKEQDLDVFKQNAMALIHEAQKTIIKEYPDVMEIILKLAYALTIIGTVDILMNAYKNYSNNHSLFFPSATELKVREFESVLSSIPTFG